MLRLVEFVRWQHRGEVTIYECFVCVLLGILCGCCNSVFSNVNSVIGRLKQQIVRL